jgi:hypothetical protein
MLIVLKYSSDTKDIEILPFSIPPEDKFWIQKDTNEKYQVGEFSNDYLDQTSDRPILVYDSENICHIRRIKIFFENRHKKQSS